MESPAFPSITGEGKAVVKTSTSLVAKDLGPPDLRYTQKGHGYSNLRTDDEECEVIPNCC